MLHDIHKHKRKAVEYCRSCLYYCTTPKGDHGNCHRFPPPSATSGHVTVYPDGWCGEYAEDEHKMAELGKDYKAEAKSYAESVAQSHAETAEKIKKGA